MTSLSAPPAVRPWSSGPAVAACVPRPRLPTPRETHGPPWLGSVGVCAGGRLEGFPSSLPPDRVKAGFPQASLAPRASHTSPSCRGAAGIPHCRGSCTPELPPLQAPSLLRPHLRVLPVSLWSPCWALGTQTQHQCPLLEEPAVDCLRNPFPTTDREEVTSCADKGAQRCSLTLPDAVPSSCKWAARICCTQLHRTKPLRDSSERAVTQEVMRGHAPGCSTGWPGGSRGCFCFCAFSCMQDEK